MSINYLNIYDNIFSLYENPGENQHYFLIENDKFPNLNNSLYNNFIRIMNSNNNIENNIENCSILLSILFLLQCICLGTSDNTHDLKQSLFRIYSDDGVHKLKVDIQKGLYLKPIDIKIKPSLINKVGRSIRSLTNQNPKSNYRKYVIFMSVIRKLFKNIINLEIQGMKYYDLISRMIIDTKYDLYINNQNRFHKIDSYLMYFSYFFLFKIGNIMNELVLAIKNNLSSESELIERFSNPEPFNQLFEQEKEFFYTIKTDLLRTINDRLNIRTNDHISTQLFEQTKAMINGLETINQDSYRNSGYEIVKNIFKLYRHLYNNYGLVKYNYTEEKHTGYQNNEGNAIFETIHQVMYKRNSYYASDIYRNIYNVFYMKYLRNIYYKALNIYNHNLANLCKNIYFISNYLIKSSPLRLFDTSLPNYELKTFNPEYQNNTIIRSNKPKYSYILYNEDLDTRLEISIKNELLIHNLPEELIKRNIYLNKIMNVNIQEIINQNINTIRNLIGNVIGSHDLLNDNLYDAYKIFKQYRFIHHIDIMIGQHRIINNIPIVTINNNVPQFRVKNSKIITKQIKDALLLKYKKASNIPNYNLEAHVHNNEDINEACPICLDRFITKNTNSVNGFKNSGGVIQLPCKHKYHINCLKTQPISRCGLCRQQYVVLGGKKSVKKYSKKSVKKYVKKSVKKYVKKSIKK